MMIEPKLYHKRKVCRLKACLVVKKFFQNEKADYSVSSTRPVLFGMLCLLVKKLVSEESHILRVDALTGFLNRVIDGHLHASWFIVLYTQKNGRYGSGQFPNRSLKN